MRVVFIKLIFILSLFSKLVFAQQPQTIKDCGEYSLTGYFEVIKSAEHNQKKKNVFLLNKGTNSEIKIYFEKDIPPENLKGVKSILKINILSECLYLCEGKFISVEKVLDPFDSITIYKGLIAIPLDAKKQSCRKNIFYPLR